MTDTPEGVSQWKENGKKFGYWDFFKKEVLREFVPKLRGDLMDFKGDWDELQDIITERLLKETHDYGEEENIPDIRN